MALCGPRSKDFADKSQVFCGGQNSKHCRSNLQTRAAGLSENGTMSSERGQTGDITLPQTYVVKYLGCRDARGLWGIKHTRHPVDELVAAARALQPGVTLPYLRLEVSGKGVRLSAMPQNQNQNFEAGLYPIESISYGVQDLVYTRVFAMIVVRDGGNVMEKHPFLCHAFVCDSRQNARSLTLTLAKAFQDYSRSVKGMPPPKKFAIDLRSQEEIQADMEVPQESQA